MNKETIKWSDITPEEFEKFCFSLLGSLDFINLNFKAGTADKGRDIECERIIKEPDGNHYIQRWFVECKHESKTISVDRLYSKIAWADAHNPDYFLLITSSRLTNQAKEWIEEIKNSKSYNIRIWDKEILEKMALENSSARDVFMKFFPQQGILHIIYSKYKAFSMANNFLTDNEIKSLINLKSIELDKDLWLFALQSLIENDYYEIDGTNADEVFIQYCESAKLRWLSDRIFAPNIDLIDTYTLLNDSQSSTVEKLIFLLIGRLSKEIANLNIGGLVVSSCINEKYIDINSLEKIVSEIIEKTDTINVSSFIPDAIAYGLGRLSDYDDDYFLLDIIDSEIGKRGSEDSIVKYFMLGRLFNKRPLPKSLNPFLSNKKPSRKDIYLSKIDVEKELCSTIISFLESSCKKTRQSGLKLVASMSFSKELQPVIQILLKNGIETYKENEIDYLKAISKHCPYEDFNNAFMNLVNISDEFETKKAIKSIETWDFPSVVRDNLKSELLIKLIDSEDSEVAAIALMILGERHIILPSETIERVLKNKDEKLKNIAMIIIGLNKISQYSDLLVKGLQSENSSTRQACVYSLGKLLNRKAEKFIQGMLKDPNPHVRGQAAQVLGKIGIKVSTIGMLEELLDDCNSHDLYSWSNNSCRITEYHSEIGSDAEEAIHQIEARIHGIKYNDFE